MLTKTYTGPLYKRLDKPFALALRASVLFVLSTNGRWKAQETQEKFTEAARSALSPKEKSLQSSYIDLFNEHVIRQINALSTNPQASTRKDLTCADEIISRLSHGATQTTIPNETYKGGTGSEWLQEGRDRTKLARRLTHLGELQAKITAQAIGIAFVQAVLPVDVLKEDTQSELLSLGHTTLAKACSKTLTV